jgi:chemotaxis protein CheZ
LASSDEVGVGETDIQRPLTRDEIAHIVQDVLTHMHDGQGAGIGGLYRELGALALFIRQARDDIAAIRPDEIRSTDIPRATDELDAVVGATEAATNTIMDAAENLSSIGGEVGGDVETRVTEIVGRIYEACSFQDITGQRITKVVRTLKAIEHKVERLLRAFGDEAGAGAGDVLAEPVGDAALLNGPQLPGKAMDQDEIDRLLADMG